MAVVYLSPSEHGKGKNKCLHKDCYEDKHTRPIAEVTAKYLALSGVDYKIAKAGTTMAQRCTESNKAKADLHVPIHTNASSSADARYLLFMFWDDNATYRKIFNAVSPELEAVYPGKKDAKYSVRKDLYEVKTPKAKTLYCELGFHTNKTDCDEFIHNEEMVGKALAKGICKYLGVTFKEEEKPVVKQEVEQEAPKPVTSSIKVGDNVRILSGARDLNNKKTFAPFVHKKTYRVIEVSGNRVVFGIGNKVTGAVDKAYVKVQ